MDEFQVISDQAWNQVLEVKSMPMGLRQRRQAGYGQQGQGYGEQKPGYGEQKPSYGEAQLPKSYPLPNTYEKPDTGAPTCGKPPSFSLKYILYLFSMQQPKQMSFGRKSATLHIG